MNYYDELIENINKLIENNEYEEAKRLILNEFALPYIPRDIEDKLKEFLNIVNQNTKVSKSLTDDEIVCYLSGDDNQQLLGVNELGRKNIREYIDICNDYLISNGNANAKALLIDSLIRQEVNYEFTYINNNSLLKFNPINLKLIEKTDGFIEGSKKLSDYFMKDPSKLSLALQLLFKEAILALPNEIKGIDVSKKIIDYIEDAFSAK